MSSTSDTFIHDTYFWFSPVGLAALAIVFLLLLLAAAVLLGFLSWLRKRGRSEESAQENLTIDISALEAFGPPSVGPRLEVYGTPVRLAVFVLAPVGSGSALPEREAMNMIIDRWLPNLNNVLAAHQPIFRRWRGQISSQGFIHALFRNMSLPGEAGKGTPWCAVAGKFETGSQQYLAGLICCAEQPNGLGQVVIEHSGQWLDVVRVHQER